MENTKRTPDLDVSDESYQGPSAHIAALGTGVVKHLKWAFIGIGIGGLYALLDATRAGKFIEGARTVAKGLKQEAPADAGMFVKAWHDLKYAGGSVLHFAFGDKEMAQVLRNACKSGDCAEIANREKTAEWFNDVAMSKEQGFGSWFFSHIPGSIPFVGKNLRKALHAGTETLETHPITGVVTSTIKNPRWTNALTFGGAIGLGGYVSGWLVALFTGATHGNKGKHQFERAKSQIQNLQEDNQDLNKINDELHAKYIKAATRLDTIQAAQDAARSELPAAASEASSMNQAASPTTEVQLEKNQHQGKLAQQDLAAAVA